MERHDVEREQKLARLRLIEAALHATESGVVVLERDGTVAFANAPAQELLAAGALITPHGRVIEKGELPMVRALETGEPGARVVLHPGPEGSRNMIVTEGKPVQSSSGDLIGAVGAFLEASPRDLAITLGQAPIGIAVLRGPELIYEYVNEAFQSFSPTIQLVGLPFETASWELPGVLARLKEVWATGEPWHGTDVRFRVERAPGLLVDGYFTFSCVKVKRRTPPDAILGFVLETTALVNGLNDAHDRTVELKAIIDTMLEGVVVFDRDRRITLINEAAHKQLSDINVEPKVLENVEDLLRTLDGVTEGTPIDRGSLPVVRALAGETSRLRLRFWNPVTSRHGYASVGAAPLRDPQGQVVGAVAVGSDITELGELDRLKDEFIRVVAHELKTPITTIKGFATALGESLGGRLSPAQGRMLRALCRNADRINRIMCELLDAQQIELGRLELVEEPVDLAELLQDVTDRIAANASKHDIRLTVSSPVVVRADGERLREVMRILLDNAVRYSPDGGEVNVALRVEGDWARVSVCDHGVGIPEERRARLFERFYRAHTNTPFDYGGTGLGLYVARAILESHGGSIWYESPAGGGSTFTFRLPLGTRP